MTLSNSHRVTKDYLSSSGIRSAKFTSVYNFPAQCIAFAWKLVQFEFRSLAVRDTKLRSRLSKNTHLSHGAILGILIEVSGKVLG